MKPKFLFILLVFLVCICSTGCDDSDPQVTAEPIPTTSSTSSPIPPNKFDPITISGLKKTFFGKAYYKIEGKLKDSSGKKLPGEYINIGVIAYRKNGNPNVLTKYTTEVTTDNNGNFEIKVFVPSNKERAKSAWSTEFKDKVDIHFYGPRVMKAFKGK